MDEVPIILEDKDLKYIVELIEKDLAGAKSVIEDCDIIEEHNLDKSIPNVNTAKGIRKVAEENVKQAEELLEQLRYFYRHFKVKGKE